MYPPGVGYIDPKGLKNRVKESEAVWKHGCKPYGRGHPRLCMEPSYDLSARVSES